MLQNTLLVCILFAFVAWYYYQKYNESEREYYKLHKHFTEVLNENQRMKERVQDLQLYKDDVSKTFKILDNELLMINDHIKKQNVTNSNSNVLLPNSNGNTRGSRVQNRISILTPEILSSLFTNMNQENIHHDNTNTNTNTYTNTNTNTNNNTNDNTNTDTVTDNQQKDVLQNTQEEQNTRETSVDVRQTEANVPLVASLTYDISYTPSDYEQFVISPMN